MANKSKTEREKVYKGKKEANLPKYVDMGKFNYKVIKPSEWECMACHSNSLLPMEYGCKMCQPFTKGAKLSGRKYK